jgi:ABC-2 type transport system ATP-binding protein
MKALEIRQLYKTYNNGIHALKGIDLTVLQGDFFALLGANGAGKSTTIGLITSLLTKTSGKICINGYDLDKNTVAAKKSLGLVPQEINLNIFETCQEILLNQAGYYGLTRTSVISHVHNLLQQLGIWDKRKSIVRHLSGGMKRRLMIARALVHQPKLLILDEPTAGVDIEIRRSLWDFLTRINHEGTTIILTTHYLEEAESLCKNIAIINNGHIIENTSMKQLLKKLNHQTFIFTTQSPINDLPNLEPFPAIKYDAHTFELKMDNQYTLNDVFSLLDQSDLKIASIRNKTNRLEELFLELIS